MKTCDILSFFLVCKVMEINVDVDDEPIEEPPLDLDAAAQHWAEDWIGWKCEICFEYAKDQLGIDWQELKEECCVYTDRIDGSKWVVCDSCGCRYHLKCVTNESEQEVAKKRFYCTFGECKK